jgi:hypothetical protein
MEANAPKASAFRKFGDTLMMMTSPSTPSLPNTYHNKCCGATKSAENAGLANACAAQ